MTQQNKNFPFCESTVGIFIHELLINRFNTYNCKKYLKPRKILYDFFMIL